LISNNSWKQHLDDKGRLFIDRNGELFAYILDYLRKGKFYQERIAEQNRLLLIDEAEFYGLKELNLLLNEPDDKQNDEVEKLRNKIHSLHKELLDATEKILKNDKLLEDLSNEIKLKEKIILEIDNEIIRKNKEIIELNNKLKEEESRNALFAGGTLLDRDQQLKLNEFYGAHNQQWQLIYKATRSGFSASTFHQLCDDKGATMTVIKSSEGWMFGGFTTQSWSGNPVWKKDPQAFIFTLTNPHNIPATKFSIKDGEQQHAIYVHGGYGPTFGLGHDIHIINNSNTNTNSHTNPHSYHDTTGKGITLFTGSRHFTSWDIEVYTIIK